MDSERTHPSWLDRLGLLGILLVAAGLHLFRLDRVGWGNLYYAATVRSMLTSWHNFLYASFDPGGFVTVDKPPLGFWVQTAAAVLFGFRGFSLMLPQVFAGILSVALTYKLAVRAFGVGAALLAALFLATTPISVAANRNNTQDSLVVLCCLLAAYAASRAAEEGRLGWLGLAAAWLGLGFEIKMMQAYLVLPALFALYLLMARASWPKRLLHLGIAAAVLIVVSLAWPLTVDLTPKDRRPFIGSSGDNTVMGLILGHNGLNRLLPGGFNRLLHLLPTRRPSQPQPPLGPPQGQTPQPVVPAPQPVQPVAGPPPGPGIHGEIGATGALRLFNKQLGGQASWFLPLALVGLMAAAWQKNGIGRRRRWQGLLLWGLWLATQVVFFSVASLFHRYYLAMMAPAIATLAGAGVAGLLSDYRQPGVRGWLLPLILLGSAVVEAILLRPFPVWAERLAAPVLGVCGGVSAVLALGRWWGLLRRALIVPVVVTVIGVLALCVPPLVWAAMPVWSGGNVALPAAGPEALQAQGGVREIVYSPLMRYLESENKGEQFLAATLNANMAAPIILATGKPVMAMGGFSGGDRILTRSTLEAMVRGGQVCFFLLDAGIGDQPDLVRWIESTCILVPPERWQPRPPVLGVPPQIGAPNLPPGQRLYDCGRLRTK